MNFKQLFIVSLWASLSVAIELKGAEAVASPAKADPSSEPHKQGSSIFNRLEFLKRLAAFRRKTHDHADEFPEARGRFNKSISASPEPQPRLKSTSKSDKNPGKFHLLDKLMSPLQIFRKKGFAHSRGSRRSAKGRRGAESSASAKKKGLRPSQVAQGGNSSQAVDSAVHHVNAIIGSDSAHRQNGLNPNSPQHTGNSTLGSNTSNPVNASQHHVLVNPHDTANLKNETHEHQVDHQNNNFSIAHTADSKYVILHNHPEHSDHPAHLDHPDHPAHPAHPDHPDHPDHPAHSDHPDHIGNSSHHGHSIDSDPPANSKHHNEGHLLAPANNIHSAQQSNHTVLNDGNHTHLANHSALEASNTTAQGQLEHPRRREAADFQNHTGFPEAHQPPPRHDSSRKGQSRKSLKSMKATIAGLLHRRSRGSSKHSHRAFGRGSTKPASRRSKRDVKRDPSARSSRKEMVHPGQHSNATNHISYTNHTNCTNATEHNKTAGPTQNPQPKQTIAEGSAGDVPQPQESPKKDNKITLAEAHQGQSTAKEAFSSTGSPRPAHLAFNMKETPNGFYFIGSNK